MLIRRKMLKLLGLSGLGVVAAPHLAWSQEFPSQPITIVVPYAPGASDQEARSLARHMEKVLKQPVQVENRAGGGATIGTNAVARSKPDGYTLLYVASTPITVAPYIRKLPYKFEDLQPIGQATQGTHLVVARTDAPFSDFAGMVAYAKANPGKISIGNSGGTGGATHLANEAMAAAAGITLNHIPFEGLSQSVAALLGGVLDTATGLPIALMPQIEAGRIRPIVQMGDIRNPYIPNTPTLREAGVNLTLNVTLGFYGPQGMPKAVLDKLAAAIEASVASPEFVAFAQNVKTVPRFRGPDQFLGALEPERRLFAEMIPKMNISEK